MENQYYIASVSWGKDSLAMLLELIYRGNLLNEVVFYDTGMEFEAIYQTRDKMLPILKIMVIAYKELTPEYAFTYKMFEKCQLSATQSEVVTFANIISTFHFRRAVATIQKASFIKNTMNVMAACRLKNHHTAKEAVNCWS